MAHTYTSLLTHVIFSTKNRVPALAPDMCEEVEKYICGVAKNLGITTIAINSVADHAHMLVKIPASLSVADAVGKLKSNSSRFIHEEWRDQPRFDWQAGYGAFSVARSGVENLVRYIDHQEEHHRKRTFQEEYLDFLTKYEIPYDPRYVWS